MKLTIDDFSGSICLSVLSILPSTIVAEVLFAKSFLAFPSPLPPLVAHIIIFLPLKHKALHGHRYG